MTRRDWFRTMLLGGLATPIVRWFPPAQNWLQRALNMAKPGDTIIVPAGQVYRGIVLNAHRPGGWITIRTERVLPKPGTRVTPEYFR